MTDIAPHLSKLTSVHYWRERAQRLLTKLRPPARSWRESIAELVQRRRRLVRAVALGAGLFVLAPYVATLFYLIIDPPLSAHMLSQALRGYPVDYEWRDLDEISPNLVSQVIVSEDARFCQHWGVDWSAIDSAIDSAEEGGKPRGASTITMQTAKNLFLWSRPAFIRKIFELPLAYFVDFTLGKRRTIEIYLNIAEWAPGVYGAEAAARHHFGKSARHLSPQEAAQLAAALPNPKRRNAGRPGPATFALAHRLRVRAAREREAPACVLGREY